MRLLVLIGIVNQFTIYGEICTKGTQTNIRSYDMLGSARPSSYCCRRR